MKKIFGTGVALVTPFKKDKSVDFDALSRVIDFVTEGGADFLVALGTTAETPTLSKSEKSEILSFVIERNAGKLPIVAGAASNDTETAVDNVSSLPDGIDAALIVTPYYNKPTQKGLIEHFTTVAYESRHPIIMYNVPGRTGVNMTAETCLRLAQHRNIIATKEASGNINQIGYILRDRPDDFLVLSGDDGLVLPQLAIGIDGVISVAANSYPSMFSGMVKYGLQGRFKEAASLHLEMIEAIDLLFAEGSPTGVKAALKIKGLIENNLRLPLVASSDVLASKLQKFDHLK